MRYSTILGLISAVGVHAHPQSRESTHNHLNKRGVDISQYAMPDVSVYTKTALVTKEATKIARSDYVETATELVKSVFPKLEFRVVDDHYVGTNGISHVQFKQTAHGIDIDNADFNVNIGRDGKVFSYGNSFFTGTLPETTPLRKRDYSDPVAALRGVVDTLGLPVEIGTGTDIQGGVSNADSRTYSITGVSGVSESPKARLVYFQQGKDSDLKLTWRIETQGALNWLLSYVDASTTTDVYGVVDYISDFATYQVYPWNVTNPDEGDRVILEDPWLLSASEYTWQGNPDGKYNTTYGNNAIAYTDAPNFFFPGDQFKYYKPNSSDYSFEYPFSLEEEDHTQYKNASIVQLFYTVNKYHDLLYVLGFDEVAGNFQMDNNGKGGKGGDYLHLNAQSDLGFNNALFTAGPDGSFGEILMFMFDKSVPYRDSSFESGAVIHEFTHGLSGRLTGGPANAGCLAGGQGPDLGEGWSDFFPVAINVKPGDTRNTDQVMGSWVYNNSSGTRLKPYSTNMEVNSNTYATIDTLSRYHYRGEVWTNMLYEVMWNLIDKHGKNDNDFPNLDENGKPDDGRYLAMKLVLDGLALQPCNPDFISARDAIIDADLALTGGDNVCEIWAGFSKRGLGPNAVASPRTEDYELPEGC